jgi:hypothetical protein
MSDSDENIWTRRHYLPNPWRLSQPLFSRRMLRRYLFCVVFLATLIAFFYAEEDLRGKYAWTHYMNQSKAKGIQLDWHAYVPPPVPDDQNFAMTPPFAKMFSYEWVSNRVDWQDTNIWSRMEWASLWLRPPALKLKNGLQIRPPEPKLGDWVRGQPLNLKSWQAYFRTGSSPQTNDWPVSAQPGEPAADVLLALSKLDPDLEPIRKASARPQSRFPIHYDELPEALLVHLAFLANVSRLLQLHAVAELELGHNHQAFADVNLAFYLADAIKSDAFMISQIVRNSMMEGALEPVWEGLRSHRWSEEQLKDFQRRFSRIDLLFQYDQSAKAQVAFTCGWIESLAGDVSTYSMPEPGEPPYGALEEAMDAELLPRGWLYQNELTAARFYEESFVSDVAPQIQQVYPGLSQTNAEAFDRILYSPYSFAFKHLDRFVSPQGFAHIQTGVNLAFVACALERHRMARGHFPDSLNALAPDFVEKLPHDIISGEPLKYRLSSDGSFILYSVGWNEKDDGGAYPGAETPSNKGFLSLSKYHPETGDLVWKYSSASPSE